ncbi:MAG TPA: anti-sigma factor [Kofleriaceae bacterium]|nr:anti-sigma factor [Kofleriaceae bacterium]
MSLCQSIDTLAMAFLDDELAAEERRELELHLLDCASCRQHVDSERGDIELVRKALVAPPASALLKARIARALDAEDAAAARSERRRWSHWVLPGSAMLAAAAAIAVFVGVGVTGSGDSPVALGDVAKQQTHSLPLEVQGASTGRWLRENFAPVEPPQFTEPGIALLGARLLPNGIANHDAALLQYLVTVGANRLTLTAVVLKDLRGDELSGGQAYQVGDLVLHVHDANGMPAVTYVDPVDHVGYVFASERMTADELIRLVVSSDLIARAQERR